MDETKGSDMAAIVAGESKHYVTREVVDQVVQHEVGNLEKLTMGKFANLERMITDLGARMDRKFDSNDHKLEKLEGQLSGLHTDLTTLKTEVASIKSDVGQLSVLRTEVITIKGGIGLLKWLFGTVLAVVVASSAGLNIVNLLRVLSGK